MMSAEKQCKQLPITEYRSNILKLIRDNSVICIEGETGCGKSTKLPQFILDEALSQDEPTYCNIMVTQPRRVAAVKVAERVAAERGERVGKTVGYCVGGDHHRAPQTRLTFCTVGFFLQVRITLFMIIIFFFFFGYSLHFVDSGVYRITILVSQLLLKVLICSFIHTSQLLF